MSPLLLLSDANKYSGQYVAKRSFTHKEPICSGDDPVKVKKEAEGQGFEDAVVFYVPEKDTVHIY